MNSYIEEVYSMLMEGHKEWAELERENDKPAEVFDAHPISAMKVSDGDLPAEEETIAITDTWKPEWQRGVQVPVNPPTDFPQTVVRTLDLQSDRKRAKFEMPKELLRCSKDNGDNGGSTETPSTNYHRVNLEEMFAGICRYDIDQLDYAWICVVNEERKCLRQRLVEEWMVEQVIEALEILTHDKLQEAQKQVKDDGRGLEYDETVLCDVCKEPDGEDGNEMVFCDGCDVCVHQACYGIVNIPDGTWLCRPCSLGFKAVCALCPKAGGALKPARDGARWCHVSCALWIPEAGFGDVEKMEPITRITDIPPARWALLCCLCRERMGACIQCAVKTCKTAFHVTCAYQRGLSMQQHLHGDDVRMMAYCPRHSSPAGQGPAGRHPATQQQQQAQDSQQQPAGAAAAAGTAARPGAELDADFHRLVSLDELRTHLAGKELSIPADVCQLVADYWKLKRRAANNLPLLKVGERPPVIDEEHARLVARMQMFITLRHDLERARNLCYMILRREKMKRSRFKAHEALVKAVCRRVKKQARTMADAEVTEMAAMPFFPGDIYDCGATFAANTLLYARKCPDQELMTRQELARLQEQRQVPVTAPSAPSAAPAGDAKPSPLREVADRPRPTPTPPGATPTGKTAPPEAPGKGKVAPVPGKPVKGKRGRPPLKRKSSVSRDVTTEWVSVDDLLDTVSPIAQIPRDQLLVGSSIRERLRGGLSRAAYRGLIRGVGASATVTGAVGQVLRDNSTTSNSKNIFDRLMGTKGCE